MIPHISGNGDGESLVWPAPVRAAMKRRDALETGAALLESNLGFRALWTIDKRPIPALTPHGVADATGDPRILTEWSFCWPDCELAVVPGERFAVIDVDDAGSDPGAMGIPAGTWAERTQRGSHHFVLLGKPGRKSKLPGARGDFLTGNGAYVVMSPSPDRWPVDLDAPIHRLAEDSPLFRAPLAHLDAIPRLGTITAADRREARRVIGELHRAPADIAHDARLLMAGIVPRDASASEADYRLALLASFHSDCPEVIASVLDASQLKRPKWHLHPTYFAQTIERALARRQELVSRGGFVSETASDSIGHMISAGNDRLAGPFSNPGTPERELMGHFLSGGVKNRVVSAVLAFVAGDQKSGLDSPFRRGENWTRIPVSDLADHLGVDRKTITRALEKLASAGIVERQTVVSRVNGSARADSLVRIVGLEDGS